MIKKFIFYYYFSLFGIENRRRRESKKYDWISPWMQVSLITLGLFFIALALFYGATGMSVSINPRIGGIAAGLITFGPTYILLFKIWKIKDQEDVTKYLTLTRKDKIYTYCIFFASLLLFPIALALDFYFDTIWDQ